MLGFGLRWEKQPIYSLQEPRNYEISERKANQILQVAIFKRYSVTSTVATEKFINTE